MTKKMILNVLLLTTIIGFSGCGSSTVAPPPKPKTIPITDDTALSENEKQEILNFVVSKNKGIYPSNMVGEYTSSNGCLKLYEHIYKVDWYNIHNHYSSCFIVKNNNITTNYHSSCEKREKEKCARITFNTMIDQLFLILPELYDQEIIKYKKFKPEYIKNKDALQATKEKLNIVTIDSTNILTSKVLNNIYKYNKSDFHTSITNSMFELYKTGMTENNFIISNNEPLKSYERYKIAYKGQTHYKDSFKKFPKDVEFKITGLMFNYLPDVISRSNKEIEVTIKTNGSRNIQLINKTNNYININSVSYYYGADIITRNINVKLPPQGKSEHVFIMEQFTNNRFLPLTKKDQKITVGLAVEYTNIKYNKQDSLLYLKKISHRDY